MNVPEWLITPFDMKIDNKGDGSDLEDELIEIVRLANCKIKVWPQAKTALW